MNQRHTRPEIDPATVVAACCCARGSCRHAEVVDSPTVGALALVHQHRDVGRACQNNVTLSFLDFDLNSLSMHRPGACMPPEGAARMTVGQQCRQNIWLEQLLLMHTGDGDNDCLGRPIEAPGAIWVDDRPSAEPQGWIVRLHQQG